MSGGFRALGQGFRTQGSPQQAVELADGAKVLGDLWFGSDTNGPKLALEGSTQISMKYNGNAQFTMGPLNVAAAALRFGGAMASTNQKVSAVNATADKLVNVFTGSTPTVTMPSANYSFVWVKHAGSGNMTVDGNGANIDGAATDTLSAGEMALYYNNATEWKRLS